MRQRDWQIYQYLPMRLVVRAKAIDKRDAKRGAAWVMIEARSRNLNVSAKNRHSNQIETLSLEQLFEHKWLKVRLYRGV